MSSNKHVIRVGDTYEGAYNNRFQIMSKDETFKTIDTTDRIYWYGVDAEGNEFIPGIATHRGLISRSPEATRQIGDVTSWVILEEVADKCNISNLLPSTGNMSDTNIQVLGTADSSNLDYKVIAENLGFTEGIEKEVEFDREKPSEDYSDAFDILKSMIGK